MIFPDHLFTHLKNLKIKGKLSQDQMGYAREYLRTLNYLLQCKSGGVLFWRQSYFTCTMVEEFKTGIYVEFLQLIKHLQGCRTISITGAYFILIFLSFKTRLNKPGLQKSSKYFLHFKIQCRGLRIWIQLENGN